jgi:hypothetical protein
MESKSIISLVFILLPLQIFSQIYKIDAGKIVITQDSICRVQKTMSSCLYRNNNFVDSISVASPSLSIKYYFSNNFLSELKISIQKAKPVFLSFDNGILIKFRDKNLTPIHTAIKDTQITLNNIVSLQIKGQNDTLESLNISCGNDYNFFFRRLPSISYNKYESFLMNNITKEINSPKINFEDYRILEYNFLKMGKKETLFQLWTSFAIYDRMRISIYNKNGKLKEEKIIMYSH